MNRLSAFTDWYESLQARERLMVAGAAIILIGTLFYLLLWEPVYMGLEREQQKQASQQQVLGWMQQASGEARALRSSGARTSVRNANAPVSLSVEQTITTAGLKNNISKIESSGKDSARVVLDAVSFNQMIIWLNTLEQSYGIQAQSATIERNEKTGFVDARLSLSRI